MKPVAAHSSNFHAKDSQSRLKPTLMSSKKFVKNQFQSFHPHLLQEHSIGDYHEQACQVKEKERPMNDRSTKILNDCNSAFTQFFCATPLHLNADFNGFVMRKPEKKLFDVMFFSSQSDGLSPRSR